MTDFVQFRFMLFVFGKIEQNENERNLFSAISLVSATNEICLKFCSISSFTQNSNFAHACIILYMHLHMLLSLSFLGQVKNWIVSLFEYLKEAFRSHCSCCTLLNGKNWIASTGVGWSTHVKQKIMAT